MIEGPLRESTQYAPCPKPEAIEVGQVWRHKWMQGRPLAIIAIEVRNGCCPMTFDEPVRCAIFRKNQSSMEDSMLEEANWEFLGKLA